MYSYTFLLTKSKKMPTPVTVRNFQSHVAQNLHTSQAKETVLGHSCSTGTMEEI